MKHELTKGTLGKQLVHKLEFSPVLGYVVVQATTWIDVESLCFLLLILSLPLIGCVTLHKLINFSVAHFLHWKMGKVIGLPCGQGYYDD